jgi:hypothetical protein
MLGHGAYEAVYLRGVAWPGAELAADRPREARRSAGDELSRGGRERRPEVEGGFRTDDSWERVVDLVVRARE